MSKWIIRCKNDIFALSVRTKYRNNKSLHWQKIQWSIYCAVSFVTRKITSPAGMRVFDRAPSGSSRAAQHFVGATLFFVRHTVQSSSANGRNRKKQLNFRRRRETLATIKSRVTRNCGLSNISVDKSHGIAHPPLHANYKEYDSFIGISFPCRQIRV